MIRSQYTVDKVIVLQLLHHQGHTLSPHDLQFVVMKTAIQYSCKRCIFNSTFGEKAFRSCPSHRTPVGKTKLFPIIKDEARILILIGVIILAGKAALFMSMAVDRTRFASLKH